MSLQNLLKPNNYELEVSSLVFNNSPSSLNYYREFSGTLSAGGAIPATTCQYRAVIIGKTVNISIISFPAPSATSTTQIPIQGLPAQFKPLRVQYSLAPVNVNGVISTGGSIRIDTDALLTLSTNTLGTGDFTSGQAAGLGVQEGMYYSFSYTLN